MGDSLGNPPTLTFVQEPIGEANASKEVSDNPNDTRNSVYSRVAALERKIELLNVTVTQAPPRKKAPAPKAPDEEKKTEAAPAGTTTSAEPEKKTVK